MRFLSGLISKNKANRPAWEGRLIAAVSQTSAIGYERPSSQENYSAGVVEHVVEGQAVQLKFPGTWALQVAAPTFQQLITLLGNIIDITLLEDGWTYVGNGSKLLQKKCTPPGRATWMENMSLTIAPVGSYLTK